MAIDGVLTIPLDRNQQRPDLHGLLQFAGKDPDVRVVLLRLAPESVLPGSTPEAVMPGPTRHPSPAAGDGLRVEPAMTADLLRGLHQPLIAMVAGVCDAASVPILEACDIVFSADDARFVLDGQAAFDGKEAERQGVVTLSFPAADLERETEALARELAGKDPLALRFTRQTLRSVGALDWDAVLAFNAAKVAELQALRAGKPSPQDLAVQSFLAGRSKPGLGT